MSFLNDRAVNVAIRRVARLTTQLANAKRRVIVVAGKAAERQIARMSKTLAAPTRPQRKMSAAGRAAISKAAKRRWAAQRKAASK